MLFLLMGWGVTMLADLWQERRKRRVWAVCGQFTKWVNVSPPDAESSWTALVLVLGKAPESGNAGAFWTGTVLPRRIQGDMRFRAGDLFYLSEPLYNALPAVGHYRIYYTLNFRIVNIEEHIDGLSGCEFTWFPRLPAIRQKADSTHDFPDVPRRPDRDIRREDDFPDDR